jgi:hypothetical protein
VGALSLHASHELAGVEVQYRGGPCHAFRYPADMNPNVEAEWIAAGVGGLGILSTAIIGVVSGRNSRAANNATIEATKANNEATLDAAREAWLRDKRAEFYSDLLTYISWRQAEVRRRTRELDPGDTGSLPSDYQPPAWQVLDGRLLALAPVEVVVAVQQAMTSSGRAELAYNDWAKAGKASVGPEIDKALKARQAFEDANDNVIEIVRTAQIGAGPPIPDWQAPRPAIPGEQRV